MNQRVVSARFLYLPIRVSIRGRDLELEALLDTGFDGDLIIAAGAFPDMRPADNYLRWRLADGSLLRIPVYLGSAEIGLLGPFEITASIFGPEHIVGRSVTDRLGVFLDHGRHLVVEA